MGRLFRYGHKSNNSAEQNGRIPYSHKTFDISDPKLFVVNSCLCGVCSSTVQQATVEGRQPEPIDWVLHLLLPQCMNYKTRMSIREKYGMGEPDLVEDCVIGSMFCVPCSIHQQIKELESRGDKPAGFMMD